MLTMEEKRKIAARLFFNDNQDQYEDYHEAAVEMLNQDNCSDSFIETCVEPFLTAETGHTNLVNLQNGHVASVREQDGYFKPLTEMTQTDGEQFEEEYNEAMDKYPELEGHPLLEKIGWKVIAAN